MTAITTYNYCYYLCSFCYHFYTTITTTITGSITIIHIIIMTVNAATTTISINTSGVILCNTWMCTYSTKLRHLTHQSYFKRWNWVCFFFMEKTDYFSWQHQVFSFILMVMLMTARLYLNSCSCGWPGFVTQTFLAATYANAGVEGEAGTFNSRMSLGEQLLRWEGKHTL